MGVDAQMLVKTTSRMTDDGLLKIARDLWGCFPQQMFVLRGSSPRHCLTFTDEYLQDAPSIFPEQRETLIEVHLWGRYYGKGYERGDLPDYLMIARFLRDRIPNCSVWYGGDSGGVEAQELTPEFEDELWGFYVDHNSRPYARYFDRGPEGLIGGIPHCDLCKMDYIRCGVGNDYAMYSCPGCGHLIETKNNGNTYTEKKGR